MNSADIAAEKLAAIAQAAAVLRKRWQARREDYAILREESDTFLVVVAVFKTVVPHFVPGGRFDSYPLRQILAPVPLSA